MGIRIDQVNLNSFKKVFPLRSDITNIVLSAFNSSDSIHVNKEDENSVSISILPATTDKIGGVIIGENINCIDGMISVSTATKTKKGIVKIGDNIDLVDGTISIKNASKEYKGLVKIGSNINVDSEGTISTDINKAYVDQKVDDLEGVIEDQVTQQISRLEETVNNQGVKIESLKQDNTQLKVSVDELKQNDIQLKVSVDELKQNDTEIEQKIKNQNLKIDSLEQNITTLKNTVNQQDAEINKIKQNASALEDVVNEQADEISDLKQSVSQLEELAILNSSVINELIKRIEMLESTISEELLELRPLLDSAFYIGSAILNGSSSETLVRLPSFFTNNSYRVCLTPNVQTNGGLGEVWISEKTESSFTIVNTGSASMVKVDFVIMTNESTSPSFNINSFPYLKGTGKFNGTTGTSVTISNLGTTNYRVMIMPVQASNTNTGDLGEYWVADKTATSFKVYNSGKDIISSFDYIVIKDGNPAYDKTDNPIMEGSSSFAGSKQAKVINFTEGEFKSNNFSVLVTPSENPNGNLGEYWVESKTTNSFTVRNTGSSLCKFDYIVLG